MAAKPLAFPKQPFDSRNAQQPHAHVPGYIPEPDLAHLKAYNLGRSQVVASHTSESWVFEILNDHL
jgi:hypothetical protein